MAGSDSFAVEQGKAERAVQWMNEQAKKNGQKFEARLAGYALQTTRFGTFEMVEWKGDWTAARGIVRKASGKLKAKVLESGYHEKRDLLSAMFGSGGTEYAKVYSGGNIVGQVELASRAGRWTVKSESFFT